MDLKYSAEDEAFRLRIRKWFEAHPPGPLETLAQRKAWQRTLYEAGMVGMGWPREYGGQDARPLEQAIVAEEMARGDVPGAINSLGLGIVGPTLIAHGTEAQKQQHIRGILTAENIWCQLYSEPDSGSDLASLKTKAVRESFNDGEYYVVNGQKVWTSLGPIADYGVLLARTDPDVPKHQGISYFILDMHSPGVEVRPLKQITGSSEFAEVFFSNVKIPVENIIGQEGQGWELAQTTLGFERGGSVLARVTRHQANMQRLLDACSHLSRDGEAALADPVVRQKLGRMVVEVEVLRYAGLRILSQLEQGKRPGAESSVDKLYYSEMDKRHQDLVLEVLGPYGQLETGIPSALALNSTTARGDSSTWAWNYLWSRAGTIYAGSSEIQKNIIGERVLKLPREPRADRAAIAAARGGA
ncbi:MAG TPA: acyl-CoA dehydrogenase family protein [Chloroflexota bacterium]|nr:acyl-CoA dehydrogenase family protein [Chloroflexota bacterium]